MKNQGIRLQKNFLQALLLLLCVACITPISVSEEKDCHEIIEIDSVEYILPERWCGKKLDSLDIADPEKLTRLPDSLTFEDYRIYVLPETRDALLVMSSEARKDSVYLIVDSGFRSVDFQKRIIKNRLEAGEDYQKVINFVAPPGYSQHHSGLAVDFVPSEAQFAKSNVYLWLKSNAAEFGFYESYPEDSTGYIPWESWHWIFKSDSLKQ